MKKEAFVTGGTGFVGLNLIETLVAEGWEVTALHRPTSDLTYLKRFGVRLAEGSITDRESLEKAIPKQADAVFHVAGDTSFWRRHNARQRQNNVTGTRNMVEISAQKQAKCFLHTSSISAWGIVSGLTDEKTPQKGKDSWINYEKTKWEAEREALKGIDLGMKVVVLNPASILGPYDRTSWGKSFFAIQKDEVPFSPPGTICFVHVREVVKAHIAAIEKGRNGHRYLLGGVYSTYDQMLKEISQLLDKKPARRAPPYVFRTLGKLFSAISYLTHKEPLISAELAHAMSRKDYRFSSEKAKKELGFQDVPLEVCVKDCYDWLVKEGLLTG